MSGFLFIQSGIFTYFRKKDYKKIGIGDFVVFISVAVSVIVLINSLLLIGILQNSAPAWILNFSRVTGLIFGVSAGILSIVHAIMPRFK
jgi:preprotein translocase subunit Sec61beta